MPWIEGDRSGKAIVGKKQQRTNRGQKAKTKSYEKAGGIDSTNSNKTRREKRTGGVERTGKPVLAARNLEEGEKRES